MSVVIFCFKTSPPVAKQGDHKDQNKKDDDPKQRVSIFYKQTIHKCDYIKQKYKELILTKKTFFLLTLYVKKYYNDDETKSQEEF